jgi:hypothetical protein
MLTIRNSALTLGLALLALQAPSYAAPDPLNPDSFSTEFGTGDRTKMVRFGLQYNAERQFFKSNGTHLGLYFDVTLAAWRGNRFMGRDEDQNIADIGFTPAFRFQNDNKLGFYAEGAIGVHLLSKLYNNDGKQLSTAFQFGDHIGMGYVFDNKVDLGLKIQHFSNGSIKKPNSGVNFLIVKVGVPF